MPSLHSRRNISLIQRNITVWMYPFKTVHVHCSDETQKEQWHPRTWNARRCLSYMTSYSEEKLKPKNHVKTKDAPSSPYICNTQQDAVLNTYAEQMARKISRKARSLHKIMPYHTHTHTVHNRTIQSHYSENNQQHESRAFIQDSWMATYVCIYNMMQDTKESTERSEHSIWYRKPKATEKNT